MATAKTLRRGLATLALTGASAVLAAPPAAADPGPPPFPPISCGVVNHEVGPLSATVHGVEPALLPVNLGVLNLAYLLHDFNCAYVINLEYLLGLQTKPQFPF